MGDQDLNGINTIKDNKLYCSQLEKPLRGDNESDWWLAF